MKTLLLLTAILSVSLLSGCCGNPDAVSAPTASELSGAFAGDTTGHPDPPAAGRRAAVLEDGGKGSYVCLIDLWWTVCPDSDFQEYRLYRSGQPGIPDDPEAASMIGTLEQASDTAFTDDGVDWSREYHYALGTVNSQGSSVWSNELSLVTPDLPEDPPTPSQLALSTVGFDSIFVEWSQCPDFDFQSYGLYSSDSPGVAEDSTAELEYETEEIASTACSRAYSLGDLPLHMALRTLDEDGNAAWSNEIEVDSTDTFFGVLGVVEVGDCPEQMALLPDGSALYVTCCSDPGMVYVLSTTSVSVAETIQVGGRPFGVCALPGGDRVWVSVPAENRLAVIDVATSQVVDTVEVGGRPLGVAATPDGGHVLAACYESRKLALVSTSTGSVEGEVELSDNPWNVLTDQAGEYAYVTCPYPDGSVSKVGLEPLGLQCDRDITPGLVASALSSDGEYLFVTSWFDGGVHVCLASNLLHEGVEYVGYNPGMITTVLDIYPTLANQGMSGVQVINPETWNTVLSEELGDGVWCPVASVDGTELYVADYTGGSVYFIGNPGESGQTASPPPSEYPGSPPPPRSHITRAMGGL